MSNTIRLDLSLDERVCMNRLSTFLITAFLLTLSFSFGAQADLVTEVGISISTEKTNTFLNELSGDFKVENEEIDFKGGGILGEVKKTGADISLDSSVKFIATSSHSLLNEKLATGASNTETVCVRLSTHPKVVVTFSFTG